MEQKRARELAAEKDKELYDPRNGMGAGEKFFTGMGAAAGGTTDLSSAGQYDSDGI